LASWTGTFRIGEIRKDVRVYAAGLRPR